MLQKHVEEFEIKRSSMQAEKRSLNAENVCVQAHIRNLAEDLHFRRLVTQENTPSANKLHNNSYNS